MAADVDHYSHRLRLVLHESQYPTHTEILTKNAAATTRWEDFGGLRRKAEIFFESRKKLKNLKICIIYFVVNVK